MNDAARRRRLAVVGVSLAALATCVGACVGVPCIPTGLRYGLWADQCPVGDLRLNANISAYGVVRGVESEVDVYPHARFLQGRAPWTSVELGALYRGVDVELTVLDREGQVVDGVEFGRARREGDARRLSMTLPELPDGDYTLRARVTAPFESIEVDAPLALYVPAAVHVLTDRPIYKPGQEVLLRSLMLARTDLEPLDGRPGRWTITAPSGIEMLVEKDLAGSWGVADTSFPLAADAEIGTWKARFASGGDEDEVSFDVRPFQLPRLTVSVSGSQRWYAIGERIAVEGTAAYASGAPVANQPLTVRLGSPAGSWPPPLAWAEPASGRTDANGRFRIELDEVPADLTERVELPVTVSVTEEAGEQVTGRTSLVLSPRGLKVDAVTELGDGLVGGVNNRVYP